MRARSKPPRTDRDYEVVLRLEFSLDRLGIMNRGRKRNNTAGFTWQSGADQIVPLRLNTLGESIRQADKPG